MILVVDASVAIKWFLHLKADEEYADRALQILAGAVSARHVLIQPPHFVAEVAAVLAREKPRDAQADRRYFDKARGDGSIIMLADLAA